MQRSPLLTSLTAIAGSLLLATAASAAELGDIAVRSYIGQPLSADIELVQIAPDEAASLQVRLAQENVYRGANISMNPALASLHMVIVRRDGRQYLRVSTTRPIEADYLHLFLELSGAGRQEVRAATVWLQADPNPGGRAGAASIAAAAAAPAPAPLPPASASVSTSESSHAEPAVVGRSRAAPMPSLHESEVGVAGGLRASAAPAPMRRAASASKPVASRNTSAAEPAVADGAVPAQVAQALLPMPNLPLPKGVKRAPAPAACSASPALAAKECAAFDAHSQELNSKLSELEGKLKVLQGALGGSAAVKGAAPLAAAVAIDKPASASATASASVTASAAAKLSTSASAVASAVASVSAHGAEPTAASAAGEAASGERWVPPPGVQGELAKARAAAAARGEAAAAAESASASAEASAAASGAASEVVSGPVKKVKVLPKLKYKKEKPPEPAPGSSNLPLIAAGASVAVLLLGLAGWLFWRKKRGAPPLKIGQLFRKKKATEPEVKHEEAPPLEDVTPESLMQQ